MAEVKVNFKEAYKCPICRHWLPIHDLIGEVIVYCRHCKNKIRVCIVPEKSTEQYEKNLYKKSQ